MSNGLIIFSLVSICYCLMFAMHSLSNWVLVHKADFQSQEIVEGIARIKKVYTIHFLAGAACFAANVALFLYNHNLEILPGTLFRILIYFLIPLLPFLGRSKIRFNTLKGEESLYRTKYKSIFCAGCLFFLLGNLLVFGIWG